MNPILAWLKSHVIVVVCGVVMLAAPVGGWFGAAAWNAGIRKDVEARRDKAERELSGVREIQYALPPLTAGGEGFTLRKAPNERVVELFRTRRDELLAMVGEVREEVIAFNRRGMAPIVDGLFPAVPAPEGEAGGNATRLQQERLVLELSRELLGAQGRPDRYAQLTAALSATGPADLARINEKVAQNIETLRATMAGARDNQTLTADEQAQIAERARLERIEEIRRHAAAASVFAMPDVLTAAAGLTRPAQPRSDAPLTDAFTWQVDFWTMQEIVRIIALANATPDGDPTPIPQSMVRRINAIAIGPILGATAAGGDGFDDGFGFGGGAPATPAGPASFTKRTPPPDGAGYISRTITLDVVLDSADLPRFIDHVERSNLMTVTDIGFDAVDPWAELAAGYALGDGYFIRATLEIEWLILNAWLDTFKPEGWTGTPGAGGPGGAGAPGLEAPGMFPGRFGGPQGLGGTGDR